jgi:hypothetical protein
MLSNIWGIPATSHSHKFLFLNASHLASSQGVMVSWEQATIKTDPTSRANISSNLNLFIFASSKWEPSRKGAKQVNLVPKAYYSHILIAQEYFRNIFG